MLGSEFDCVLSHPTERNVGVCLVRIHDFPLPNSNDSLVTSDTSCNFIFTIQEPVTECKLE